MDRKVTPRRRWATWSVLLVLLVLIAFLGAYLYPSFSRWVSADRSVALNRLRVATVKRGDLLRDVSVQGRIIAAYQPTIVSPEHGLLSILVRPGDVVEKGQVLGRIESPELQNRLEQERSTYNSLEAALERQRVENRQTDLQNRQEVSLLELRKKAAERAMARAQQLFAEGLGNAIDFEKARDEVDLVSLELAHSRRKTELEKETMDFRIRTSRLDLERQKLIVEDLERKVNELSVVSPVSGLVSRVEVKDKDTVLPNQQLFSVVDLSEFEVEVLIPENFADEISPGVEAKVRYEGREYPGLVKSLSPEVESSQVKGIVAFQGTAPSGLIQNQRVYTRLILDARRDTVKVARGPFLESLGGRQAYVVEDGIAVLRPIKVGSISVTEVEVLDGLQPGEKIVISDLTRFEGAPRLLLR